MAQDAGVDYWQLKIVLGGDTRYLDDYSTYVENEFANLSLLLAELDESLTEVGESHGKETDIFYVYSVRISKKKIKFRRASNIQRNNLFQT